jgi:PAS domain S-box-containing protein
MHGYAADELIGKNLSIFHNKEQMENVNRLNEELKRQGSYIAEEVWHTRKDNTVFPALMNGTLVMGAQGGPLFMAATTIDITERKRADEALRQQEEYFRTLIEHSYDAISIINADGTIRYHSPSYERLLGYYPEEEIGRRAPGYVHSDDIPKASRAFAQLLREPGSIVHDEVRIWHKDGSLRTLEVVGQNLLDNPAVAGIVTNFHDITERKEMEQAIQEEEERFRALIENAQDGIVILNGDGIIHYESPSMACMLGYNLEAHIGKNLFDVIHPDDVLTAADLFTQVLRTSGERINTEVRIQHQDGSWHTVHTIVHNLLDDPAVAGVVVNMRDVTESRRAEEELKQSHQQLRQLTTHLEKIREEERTVIAREIHDELGQVLTALKMDLSWMISRLKQKPLLEKAKAMLELINYSIQTVKKISMNLRPGILDDLGIVAATEWQLGELQNRTGIEYKLNISPEHISLCRERTTAIFRILQEILTNITRHANATRVEVSLTQKPDKLLLKVNDNGIGISKAEMSASQSFGLMGIRERAHSFGGRVVIKGIKNKGTTVTVSIPS